MDGRHGGPGAGPGPDPQAGGGQRVPDAGGVPRPHQVQAHPTGGRHGQDPLQHLYRPDGGGDAVPAPGGDALVRLRHPRLHHHFHRRLFGEERQYCRLWEHCHRVDYHHLHVPVRHQLRPALLRPAAGLSGRVPERGAALLHPHDRGGLGADRAEPDRTRRDRGQLPDRHGQRVPGGDADDDHRVYDQGLCPLAHVLPGGLDPGDVRRGLRRVHGGRHQADTLCAAVQESEAGGPADPAPQGRQDAGQRRRAGGGGHPVGDLLVFLRVYPAAAAGDAGGGVGRRGVHRRLYRRADVHQQCGAGL